MGLFNRNFDRPGPGVNKDAPRKKGVLRFFEVFGRDIGNLIKLNLLYQLCVLPAQAFFVLALLNGPLNPGPLFYVFLLLFLVASIPVGPATAARNFIITRMLRDDPGFLWHDFKRIFKENFKNTVAAGIVYAAMLGAQVYTLFYFVMVDVEISIWVMAIFFLSVLFFSMVAPYYFVQAPYLDLPPAGLLKNSVMLAIGYLPRSFMAAAINVACWYLLLNNIIITIIPVLIVGYTVPQLASLMWVWKPVNETFKIEETLVKREQERLDEAMEEDGAGR